MKVKGVRLYGVKDIRLEEFEIPEIAEDEILLKIECNGIAVSTLKEITLAQRHLRVPKNIKKNPVLIGHEFSGTIAKVGTRWKEDYQEGKQFVLVPEIPHQIESPGYSYPYFGGAATYCIIPADVIEKGCLLQYEADSFYELAQMAIGFIMMNNVPIGRVVLVIVWIFHFLYFGLKVETVKEEKAKEIIYD